MNKYTDNNKEVLREALRVHMRFLKMQGPDCIRKNAAWMRKHGRHPFIVSSRTLFAFLKGDKIRDKTMHVLIGMSGLVANELLDGSIDLNTPVGIGWDELPKYTPWYGDYVSDFE